jgi:hypothetical protein
MLKWFDKIRIFILHFCGNCEVILTKGRVLRFECKMQEKMKSLSKTKVNQDSEKIKICDKAARNNSR